MPCGPCGAVQLRRMLEQPWHGHPDAALLVAPTLGPHLAPRGVVDAAFRREPDQDPDRALDVSEYEARCALRQLNKQLGRQANSEAGRHTAPACFLGCGVLRSECQHYLKAPG
jgi:hypothetical protein